MLNEQQFYLFSQIQSSQTGGQLYSDTSPNGECSLTESIQIERELEKSFSCSRFLHRENFSRETKNWPIVVYLPQKAVYKNQFE